MVSKASSSGHLPVMAGEVVELLAIYKDGAYLDLTAGLGGHMKALGARLGKSARLYGLDSDPEAVGIARENLKNDSRVKEIVHSSYTQVDTVVTRFGEQVFDGILLDLGISSLQVDEPSRGFSFRFDGPLDMRFDPDSSVPTASDLVNGLSKKQLAEIISRYGEERRAGQIADAIVRERHREMILTSGQLKEIIQKTVKGPHQNKTLARVFQALRIAVNGELEALAAVLPKAGALLKPGGRLAVLTYHSLEDRAVKRFFQRESKGCICPPGLAVCICGHQPSLRVVTRKARRPSEMEIATNPRARSAKLRVAEKI